jgi:repressor LexA
MLRVYGCSDSLAPMQGLTDRQREILKFITERIDEQGYPPTIREIGEFMGIRSTNGVNDHLKALERKGYLKREGLKSRALRPVASGGAHGSSGASYGRLSAANEADTPLPPNVVEFTGDTIEVPVLGRVAAGSPILADENVETTVRVDSFFIGNTPADRVFALRVAGDSMIDAGIYDGDYIFVRKQLEARSGQIVVAMIDGEATVKRYEPDGDVVRLVPENATMKPIVIRKQDFRSTAILGIVCGVYRRMH